MESPLELAACLMTTACVHECNTVCKVVERTYKAEHHPETEKDVPSTSQHCTCISSSKSEVRRLRVLSGGGDL